jgi:hypothetical protein
MTAGVFEALVCLESAVQWVNAHQFLAEKGVSIHVWRAGTSIHLGHFWLNDERAEYINSVFSGKKASREVNAAGDESFTMKDEDSGLVFRWTIWAQTEQCKSVTDEITI